MMLLAFALQVLTLHGTVRDRSGLPVPRALVYVDGTQIATETDSQGRFEIALDALRAGTLTVFLDGFAPATQPFDAAAINGLDPLAFVLAPAAVTDSVTVTAPRAPAAPPSGFTMRLLDVVRTPGAMADLMHALQTLPGVAQADEGAGLYVRGGDTSEVLVLLDDAVVFHPYRQETPGGGLFGSVEPFLLEGVSFSTGGFPARYGNALSAVLDLHGLRRPEAPHASVTMGLAGASVRAAMPIGENGGVRVSGNRSFPGLLFAVNGRPYDFDPLPGGWDLNASAHYTSPRAGAFKLFAMVTGDAVGVRIESLAFAGLLKSSTSSAATSLHWDSVLGKQWLTTATAGVTRYVRGLDVGVLNLDTTDIRASWRGTAERSIGTWIMRLGADGVAARTHLDGAVPSHGGDLGGTRGVDAQRVRFADETAGAYVEGERRWGPVSTTIGARAEQFNLAREAVLDPRVNVTVDTAPTQRLSFAWGEYHQAPEAGYYAHTGASGLDAMRAQHVIAGYELGRETDPLHLRAEVYRKQYHELPFESAANVFTSTGYGSAHGLDLFAHVKHAPLDVTADYSYVNAVRRWTAFDDRGKYTAVPGGTWRPAFDIPYTAHVMARMDVTRTLQTSVGWRISAGVLDTPVTGATATSGGYVPVYGAIDSERLPRYERLDATINYLTRLSRRFGSTPAILFASVGNVFARGNFFQYAYSSDFSTRRPIRSATPRIVYFGAAITR